MLALQATGLRAEMMRLGALPDAQEEQPAALGAMDAEQLLQLLTSASAREAAALSDAATQHALVAGATEQDLLVTQGEQSQWGGRRRPSSKGQLVVAPKETAYPPPRRSKPKPCKKPGCDAAANKKCGYCMVHCDKPLHCVQAHRNAASATLQQQQHRQPANVAAAAMRPPAAVVPAFPAWPMWAPTLAAGIGSAMAPVHQQQLQLAARHTAAAPPWCGQPLYPAYQPQQLPGMGMVGVQQQLLQQQLLQQQLLQQQFPPVLGGVSHVPPPQPPEPQPAELPYAQGQQQQQQQQQDSPVRGKKVARRHGGSYPAHMASPEFKSPKPG